MLPIRSRRLFGLQLELYTKASLLQANFPQMGCHRHHPFSVSDDLHLY
jgi:hypothetical protein